MATPVTHVTPRQEKFSLVRLQSQEPSNRKVAIDSIIEDFQHHVEERSNHHLGYPYNLTYDYTALTELMTRYSLNNLGDPFIESNYGVHTRAFEIAVLDWFANLWDLPQDEYWGYVTACGTEGVLEGIYIGRENFPDGILYASAESHYSVFKAARMYRMEANSIPTLDHGEIDYAALTEALKKNPDRPAIINVNIGTTVKGAVDDIDKIIECLTNAGFASDRYYIHCDGALFGAMLPFLDHTSMTFKKPIGSISVSGHKFIGTNMPCGIILTRLQHIKALSSNIEYINSRDATIMGSRNGQAPIYLWYALAVKGVEGLRKDVEHCMETARQLYIMLSQKHNVPNVVLNDLSCTVVFPRPKNPAVIRKWQLACQGDICHIVVMPNVTLEKLVTFVMDYVADCDSDSDFGPGTKSVSRSQLPVCGVS